MRKKEAAEKAGESLTAAAVAPEVSAPKRTLRGIRLGQNLGATTLAPQLLAAATAAPAPVAKAAPAPTCLEALRACLWSPPRWGLTTYAALLVVVGGLASMQGGQPAEDAAAALAVQSPVSAGYAGAPRYYGPRGYPAAAYRTYPGPNDFPGAYDRYRAGLPAAYYGGAPGGW